MLRYRTQELRSSAHGYPPRTPISGAFCRPARRWPHHCLNAYDARARAFFESSNAQPSPQLTLARVRAQATVVGAPTKADIPMYAELYRQGRMNLDELISKRISLDALNEGYSALSEPGAARVVVTSF